MDLGRAIGGHTRCYGRGGAGWKEQLVRRRGSNDPVSFCSDNVFHVHGVGYFIVANGRG